MPSSSPRARLWMLNAWGTDGPVMSASSTPTFFPSLAMAAARVQVTADLPTPPLPLTTAITFLMWERALAGLRRSWGLVRSPQLSPQEEQSWVHSLILIHLLASPGHKIKISLAKKFFKNTLTGEVSRAIVCSQSYFGLRGILSDRVSQVSGNQQTHEEGRTPCRFLRTPCAAIRTPLY